jgi:flotillin
MDLGIDFVTLIGQLSELPGWVFPVAIAAIVLFLAMFLVWMVRNFFEVCEMDEALVRSGAGGARVAIQGGMWRFPIVHKFQRVTLRTLKLDIKSGAVRDVVGTAVDESSQAAVAGEGGAGIKRGMGVMRDSESLPIIIDAEVYVRVPRKEEYIIAAATSMGEKIDPEPYKPGKFTRKQKKAAQKDGFDVMTPGYAEDQATQAILLLVEQKLRSAVRGAAAVMTLGEMHTNMVGFTERVEEKLHIDLKENGLELESFAVESLDAEPFADTMSRSRDNVFDASASAALTVKFEEAETKINETEKDNLIARTERNKDFEVDRLGLEKDQVFAKEEQARDVANKEKEEAAKVSEFEAERESERITVVENADLVAQKKLEEVAMDLQVFQAVCEKDTEVAKAVNEKTFELERLSTFRIIESGEEEAKKVVALAAIDRVQGVGTKANQSKEVVGIAQATASGNIGIFEAGMEVRVAEKDRQASQEREYASLAQAKAGQAKESINTAIEEQRERTKKEAPANALAAANLVEYQNDKDKKRLEGEGDRDRKIAVAEGAVAWARGVRDGDLAQGEGAESRLAYGKATAESSRLEYTADIVKAEAALLDHDSVARYLLSKNAPELAGHLKDAVAAAFKPLENIDGFRILQVNTDGGDGSGGNGSPLTGAMKSIVNNAPAGALLNEFLQMSGMDIDLKQLVTNLVQTGSSLVASAVTGDEVVDLEEYEGES